MKKLVTIIILIITITLSLSFRVYGAPDNSISDIKNQSNIEESKINDFYNYFNNLTVDNELVKEIDARKFVQDYLANGGSKISFKKLMGAISQYFLREVVNTGKFMIAIIIVAIVAALIHNLQSSFNSENITNIATFASYAVLIILITNSMTIGVNLARDAITSMSDFMHALMPILTMLIMSVGGITQAMSMDPIVVGVLNIATNLYVRVIIPLIMIGLVLKFVNNLSGEYKIDKLTKMVNNSVLWCQGIILTVFIAIVTMRGISSKTIDLVTTKTVKFAMDNFIPIVGKALSDAIASVAGYSLLLKNALSILGLIIIVIIVLYPIIKMYIMSMLYKLTAALIEPISDKKIVNCITSAGDSLVLLNSCLISVSVMFFILLCIMASSGKAVLGG